MTRPKLNACVLCCNNAATVHLPVQSVLAPSLPVDQILVVDDKPIAVLATMPVQVSRHERCFERGAARARASNEARDELVLCCDAIPALDRDS